MELRRAKEHEDAGSEHPALEIEQEAGEPGEADDEDAVAKELALRRTRMERRARAGTNSSSSLSTEGVGVCSSHSVKCLKIRRLQ